jgi:flagellar assembly factor FliW
VSGEILEMTAVTRPALLDSSGVYIGAGLPGFPAAHRFRLMPWGDEPGPFSLLVSLDEEGLAFVVSPPEVFFPDYVPTIDRSAAHRLGISSPADIAVYVIVTPGPTPREATANLLGPLVVNRRTRLAAQVVFESTRWEMRTPLVSTCRTNE